MDVWDSATQIDRCASAAVETLEVRRALLLDGLDSVDPSRDLGGLEGKGMTRIEFWSAVMGLLVAIVVMFNQMNGRIDRLQAETNRRFEAVDGRFDQMFDRLDRAQAETNRRFDTVLETIMSFDHRVSRLEGRLDAQGTEAPAP